MSPKRSHRDDILFISALAALLVGLGLLLRTTGVSHNFHSLWPIIVMAAGGILLWFAIVRGRRPAIFIGGVFFILFGILALVGSMLHWRLSLCWPLILACLGFATLSGGLRHYHRAKMAFIVPSTTFIVLGLFLSLFSFKIVGLTFGEFIVAWWPSLLIAGGVVLFIAWGVSRKTLPEAGTPDGGDPSLKP